MLLVRSSFSSRLDQSSDLKGVELAGAGLSSQLVAVEGRSQGPEESLVPLV